MAGRGQALYTNWEKTMYFPKGEQPEGWIAYRSIPYKERINVPPLTKIASIKKEQPKVVEKYYGWFDKHDRVKLEIHDWMRKCWDLSGIDLVVFSLIYNELEISTVELNDILGMDIIKSVWRLRDDGLIKNISSRNQPAVWSITETAEV